jgi:hypothetical protein
LKRISTLVGVVGLLTAIVALSIGGTVLASPRADAGNRGEDRPYGTGTCESCVPNDYSYDYSYDYSNDYLSQGPHGANAR